MGLYQLVVSVYVLASTFASYGIVTAVTRLIADELVSGTRKSVRHILLRAISLSIILGLLSAAALYFSADFIAISIIGDARIAPSIKIISFVLPFIGLDSCLNGYFVARRNVFHNNISQLLEQGLRIWLTIILLDKLSVLGLGGMCIALLLGDVIAEIISTFHMMIFVALDLRKLPKQSKDGYVRKKGVLREIMRIATPITSGRYLTTGLRTVENIIVPTNLAKYSGSRESSLSEFGALKGMALPIIFFPASFLNAFSMLMVPEMSEANSRHQKHKIKHTVDQTLRLTLLASIPIAAIFFIFSKELGSIIFNDNNVGIILGALAPIIPLMYLESAVDGLLKGLDQQVSSLKYSVLDSGVRIIAIIAMLPFFGMKGFIFIMYISNFLTCTLNVKRLLKVAETKLNWKNWVVKPVISVGLIGAAAYMLKAQVLSHGINQIAYTMVIALAMAVIYIISLFLFGSVKPEDFSTFRKKTSVR